MSINYRNSITNECNDSFSQVLKETFETFSQKHGVSIIGRNFEDVITTPALFEEYVDSFTNGMDATSTKQIETLAESFRETTLSESLAGIQPYASLSMPVLVKLWARLAIKYAVPTEPVSMPSFTVSFMKPYVLGADGQKNYLPEALNSESDIASMKKLVEDVVLTDGKVQNYNLLTGLTIPGLPFVGGQPVAAMGKDADNNDILAGTLDNVSPEKTGSVISSHAGLVNIDRKFQITAVVYGDKVVPCSIKKDIYGKLYGELTWTADDKTVKHDTIFGVVNSENCSFTVTSMSGEATAVKILGWVASDSHRTSTEVGFDITRKDIDIGTGDHVESSLPIELLQDTKAMYQIDGAAEVVDIMSNVVAQKLDLRIFEFLKQAYASTVGSGKEFTKTFDVYPSAQYAINPSEWLKELRKLVDIVATEMKSTYKSYNGYFVILGNPIHTNILPNVVWTFQNVQDTQNGVDVQYSLGAMSGSNKYSIISSDLISVEDGLMIFFVPTTDKFKTFTYYPYTFNVVQNYLNTRNPNVPSVMLTKRDTIEEFVPIIGKINILHNDGSVYNHTPVNG